MGKNLIINISKGIFQKDRSYRVHYILHPLYYIQVSYQRGDDTQRHNGWKYDTSYNLEFSNSSVWASILQSVNIKERIILIQYLFDITIGKKPYYGMHRLYFDSLSSEEKTKIENILGKHDIHDEELLEGALVIDSIIAEYFKYRKKHHKPIGYMSPKSISYFDLYIYCKIDFYRNKVRCLLAEEYLLKHEYDAPMLIFQYKATPKNPLLVNIIDRLKDSGYIEVLYRWIEKIVEKHCEVYRIDDQHFITQKKFDDIILRHSKTRFLQTILEHIEYQTMVLIITQISESIYKEFMKLKPLEEMIIPGDTYGSKDIVQPVPTILIFPNCSVLN